MDGKELVTVSPWMENGNIVEFLRENPQANPLKLVRTMFHFMHLFIEFGYSWKTLHVAFSTSIVWISSTPT
jgi:hypothetical protein